MRFAALFLAFEILFTGTAQAFDSWDRTDYGLLAASTALMAIDWGQTRYIAENSGKYAELNPVIGRSPGRGEVDAYFAGAFLVMSGVAYVLPSGWRKAWLGGWVVLGGACVIRNDGMGIGVRW